MAGRGVAFVVVTLAGGCYAPLDLPEGPSSPHLDGGALDLASPGALDFAPGDDLAIGPMQACLPADISLSGPPWPANATLPAQMLTGFTSSYCVHLDATGLSNPYFVASTPPVAGNQSGVQLSLVWPDGTFLAESQDVTVGGAMPTTEANLFWGVPPSATIDVVLRAASADGTTHVTDIDLQLGPGLD